MAFFVLMLAKIDNALIDELWLCRYKNWVKWIDRLFKVC